MFEHRALYRLVLVPVGSRREAVYLHRQTVSGGVHKAYEDLLGIVDKRVVVHIIAGIRPEQAEVGFNRSVYRCEAAIVLLGLSGLPEPIHKGLQDRVFGRYRINVRSIDGFHGGKVHGEGLDNAAATALHHAPVILERGRHKRVRRHSDNGIIPVLHLHGCESHIKHQAVGRSAGHHNPVALMQHIVLRHLYARHKTEYAVFEHQHQGCREGTEAGKQHGR